MSNTLANEAHQRSLKDFLTLYNTITEYCFNKCVSRFNERFASDVESKCVEVCTDNYVQYNQRFMFNFVQHQDRRKRDAEREAIEAAAKAAEEAKAASAAVDAQQDTSASSPETSAATGDLASISASQEEHVQQAVKLLESMSSGTNPPSGSGTEPLAVPLDSTKTLLISDPSKLKDASLQAITSQLQEPNASKS